MQLAKALSGGMQMSIANKLVVMIPALNEGQSIGKVIDGIPVDALHSLGYEVKTIVVDGQSKDQTLEIARSKGAAVFVQKGRGKGVGVRQAFSLCYPQEVVPRALSLSNGICSDVEVLSAMLDMKYLIMLDADGTYPPEHIVEVVRSLEAGAEVVMGSRFIGSIDKGAMTPLNHIGNILLSDMATVLYQTPVTDLCTGMWGFDADALKKMDLNSIHFELEAEMFAESAKKGLRIEEVPVHYRVREGESKLVPLKAGMMIFGKLLTRRFVSAKGQIDMKISRRSDGSPSAAPTRFL